MIKISLDDVRQGSKFFLENSGEMANMVTNLQSTVDSFASVWEGQAFTKFTEEFADLRPEIDKFVTLIGDIGTQLEQIANAMEQADADIASQLGVR